MRRWQQDIQSRKIDYLGKQTQSGTRKYIVFVCHYIEKICVKNLPFKRNFQFHIWV